MTRTFFNVQKYLRFNNIQAILFLIFFVLLSTQEHNLVSSSSNIREGKKVNKFEQCKIDQIDPILDSRKQKADLSGVENKNLFLSEGGWYVTDFKVIVAQAQCSI